MRQRPLWRCQDGDALTHSYIPGDPDTGAETDAQTQGYPKATKPEKYTQTQAQNGTGRYIQSEPQTLTDIHTRLNNCAAWGLLPVPSHTGRRK